MSPVLVVINSLLIGGVYTLNRTDTKKLHKLKEWSENRFGPKGESLLLCSPFIFLTLFQPQLISLFVPLGIFFYFTRRMFFPQIFNPGEKVNFGAKLQSKKKMTLEDYGSIFNEKFTRFDKKLDGVVDSATKKYKNFKNNRSWWFLDRLDQCSLVNYTCTSWAAKKTLHQTKE